MLAACETRWRPNLGGSLLAQESGMLIPGGVLTGPWLTHAPAMRGPELTVPPSLCLTDHPRDLGRQRCSGHGPDGQRQDGLLPAPTV